MIAFFKRFIQFILGLFKSAIKIVQKTLYFDDYIRFKKAPLIGKIHRHKNQMWRVVGYEKDGNFKCELELIQTIS